MNIVRDFIETSYTNFKTDLDISGLELGMIPLIIIGLCFGFTSIYTIIRTLSQIHIDKFTFFQKDFLVGCGFISLAAFNGWFIMYLIDYFDIFIIPSAGYVLSPVWLIPALLGVNFYERWRYANLTARKRGIKRLPEWLGPFLIMAVGALLLFGVNVYFIEMNMAMDCQLIGTGEESTLTEQEAINLRNGCESTIDNSYIFLYVGLPVLATAMFLYMFFIVFRGIEEENLGWHP